MYDTPCRTRTYRCSSFECPVDVPQAVHLLRGLQGVAPEKASHVKVAFEAPCNSFRLLRLRRVAHGKTLGVVPLAFC